MRINIGAQASVTASEKWLTYIQAGQAFSAGANVAATAGVIGHIQLFNPAASGKSVLLRRVIASVGAATLVDLNVFNTALTTLSSAGFNLLIGGAASQAQVRFQTNATELGTAQVQATLGASTPLFIGPDWEAQIPAGFGVLIAPEIVNVQIVAAYYWAEF